MSFSFGAANNAQNPNNDSVVPDAPPDTVSSLSFSPQGMFLACSSWASDVRVWRLESNGQSSPVCSLAHTAPVLDISWSQDGKCLFSAGCDKIAKMWDLKTNQSRQIAQHQAPIKHIFHLPRLNSVVTGSWDKTLKYWDLRQANAVCTVQLPERVYAMDVKDPVMVVGTAGRRLFIFNLNQPQTPFREVESKELQLKLQTRCVSVFPNLTGFTVGSIEGRTAIHMIAKENHKQNFAYKCHRVGKHEIYAVNAISFSNKYPTTFATAGSDGTFHFWDYERRQRLRAFTRLQRPITACAFDSNSVFFAYAAGNDWSKGNSVPGRPSDPPQIFVHRVNDENEIRPKGGRQGGFATTATRAAAAPTFFNP